MKNFKNYVSSIEKSSYILQTQYGLKNEANQAQKPNATIGKQTVANCQRTIWVASVLAASMLGNVQVAHAALVSPCAGVSLAPSLVTDIVGAAVLPITSSLDGVLGLLLQPIGLNSNITNTLAGIAGGDPINLNVLDTDGNLVSIADQCDVASDSYTLNSPKGISIGGNSITGLGGGAAANAGEINSIAFGNASFTDVAATNSIAIGSNASIGALGTNSIAFGNGASTNVANSVALGAGSIATVGAQINYTAYGLTATQTSVGVVSVGSAGNTRKITNLAAGSATNDAVNVSQLEAVNLQLQAADERAVKYDLPDPLNLKMTVTLGGPLSGDGGTTGGTRINNLSKGAVNATSTDAVNGSQLFAISNGITTNTANIDALGLSMATNLGGSATYNPATGAVSAPTYNVFGADEINVGDAITALQTNAPLQYSDANGDATPNTPSNHVTLVGNTAGTPVTLHNVANGVAANDAVNMSQLDAVRNNVSNLDALAVKYDDNDKDIITFLGTGGTTLTNISQGEVSELSTDAVNGAQLYATNQLIANVSNGGGIKYFHAKSTHADSSATGDDSVAAGSRAVASGSGSVAMGDNSQAINTGAIAIGQNSTASGVNSIAIGVGALATGSIAVGANAQAGNGGAAFGDDAVALSPQQGTALGNAATVTANRGVALGAGAQATRTGMNGATEKYSNVSVTSTEGAVSVGSASNERQITNVAGGTADTDAVNVRQLDAAITQSGMEVNNRLNALQSDISSVRYDAHAGTASAMAMATMPQSVIPGKVMMSAGVANYQGQSAVSVGISNFSENGRWAVNVNGSANTRGNGGAAVGVGFHW